MFAASNEQVSRLRHSRPMARPVLALAALLLVPGLVFFVYRLFQQPWSQPTALPEPAVTETTEPVVVNALDPTGVADPFQGTVDTLSVRIGRLETLGTKLTQQFAGLETQLDEALAGAQSRFAQLDLLAERLQLLESQQAAFSATFAALGDQDQRLTGHDYAAELEKLNDSFARLQAENQQLLYRINAIDAMTRTVGQQLTDLRLVLLQAPTQVRPTEITTAPAQLPFTVTAIDRREQAHTVTVAEPPLAGKRRTVFLKQGDSHLGWTLTRIDGGEVTFRHYSGHILAATVEG